MTPHPVFHNEHSSSPKRRRIIDKQQYAAQTFADSFLELFRHSTYPNSEVVFRNEHGLIEVRIPPRLLSGLSSPAQFPAIEVIKLKPMLRGKGVLKRVIAGLLEQPEVVGTCISHITNSQLLAAVEQWGWHRLTTLAPELPTLYTVKDKEYKTVLRHADAGAFDERMYSADDLDRKLGFSIFRASFPRSFPFPS